LTELLAGEDRFELGLAHEHDLEELLFVGFEIGEEADLFEDLEGEVLGLVDDEDDVASGVDALEEDLVDLGNQIDLAVGVVELAELGEDGLEHLLLVDAGIDDERGVVALGVELVEESAAEGGLAAADFTDQDDEAFFLGHPVHEVLECVLMGGAEVKELRVRGDVEWHLREAVEALIHKD